MLVGTTAFRVEHTKSGRRLPVTQTLACVCTPAMVREEEVSRKGAKGAKRRQKGSELSLSLLCALCAFARNLFFPHAARRSTTGLRVLALRVELAVERRRVGRVVAG